MTTPADIPQHIDTQYSEQMLIKAPFGQSKEEFLAGINEKLQAERKEALQAISENFKESKRYEELKNIVSFKYYNGIIVACSNGNPVSFYKYNKENGAEFYSNMDYISNAEEYNFLLKKDGYKYENGNIFKNGKEIPKFLENGEINPLFIKAVDDVNFYKTTGQVYGLMKTVIEGEKLDKYPFENMLRDIISGVFRIKEVVFFAGHGYIEEKDIPKLLKRAILELPRQCADERLSKLGIEVTKEELDEYLTPTEGEPLITQAMYDRCIEIIEKRDKLIQQREAKKIDTKSEIGKERANGIIDWARNMIKGIID